MDHRAVAIIPTSDLDASEAFYRRLNFDVVSDYGTYRILEDGRGWHLHLTYTPGWPRKVEEERRTNADFNSKVSTMLDNFR